MKMTSTECQKRQTKRKRGSNNMGICPFFKESVWSGNKCQASGDGDGAPIQRRYANYCGANVMSDDYHNCPLYKDATGKNNSGGCYLTSACMSAKGEEFSDDCYELSLLRGFRDSYVKEKYPEDIAIYYEIAPKIVEKVEKSEDNVKVFEKMYNELVLAYTEINDETRKRNYHFQIIAIALLRLQRKSKILYDILNVVVSILVKAMPLFIWQLYINRSTLFIGENIIQKLIYGFFGIAGCCLSSVLWYFVFLAVIFIINLIVFKRIYKVKLKIFDWIIEKSK